MFICQVVYVFATSSDTNITSRFDLDNGQRDNFYDIGEIKIKQMQSYPRSIIS